MISHPNIFWFNLSRFTAPMFGYSNWREYYAAARLADKLASIKVCAQSPSLSHQSNKKCDRSPLWLWMLLTTPSSLETASPLKVLLGSKCHVEERTHFDLFQLEPCCHTCHSARRTYRLHGGSIANQVCGGSVITWNEIKKNSSLNLMARDLESYRVVFLTVPP